MNTLPAKLPCTALFANFFLAMALHTAVASAQSLPGSRRTDVPDASGNTAVAEYTYLCNPALFAGVDSAVAAAVVTPSRFGIAELACAELLAAWQNDDIAYGGALGGTGTSLYNELSATGFFALCVTQDFAAGAALNFLRLGIRDAQVQTALFVNLGIRLQLAPYLCAGMALHNSTRAGFGGTGSPVDQAALLSLGSRIGPDIGASGGILVRPGTTPSLLFSALYSALDSVRFRLAFQTFPHSAEGGFAWSFGAFTATGVLHYHGDLGFSQTIGCVFRW